MSEASVQLKVAGQTYQVVSSAEEAELKRLAKVVEEALMGVTTPGRQASPQALVLAAITLAHELEVERAKRDELEQRYQSMLTSLLGRVEEALAESEHLVKAPPEEEAEAVVEAKTSRSKPSLFPATLKPLG